MIYRQKKYTVSLMLQNYRKNIKPQHISVKKLLNITKKLIIITK